jgi:REP element-mobilizing transposase RayT
MVRTFISVKAEIIAYCLMPNHFHFLIYTDERIGIIIKQGSLLINPLSNGFRKLLSGYARIYNERYSKTGSLFRQKTKSKCISEKTISTSSFQQYQDQNFNCFHYIHQNPYRAGLVKKIEDWRFSSYRDYAGLRNGTLCNKELAAKYCQYDSATFIDTSYGIISDYVI